MNLIVCSQDCRHQTEGYCALNSVTSLSGSTKAKCGYYEKADKTQKVSRLSAEEPKGVR